MDKFCLYILIKCIFKSVDIIFKLFVKYLNYFEVSKKIEVFLDLFISPFIFLPTGKSPLLCRYVTHLSIVVFREDAMTVFEGVWRHKKGVTTPSMKTRAGAALRWWCLKPYATKKGHFQKFWYKMSYFAEVVS